MSKYIDPAIRLLNPQERELEPSAGDLVCASMEVRDVNVEQRTVEAVVSTADVDRYEEIIEPKAYRKWLKTFMSNPGAHALARLLQP